MIAEKELFLQEIKTKFNPEGFVAINYQKINANILAEFREKLAQVKGDFFVVKKRIFLKAAKALQLQYELEELEGHIALILAKEEFITATKVLYTFKKENENVLNILSGYFKGKKYTSKEIEQISELPSLEESRAQILGVFAAPMSQTLGVIESILTSVICCIENKSIKES